MPGPPRRARADPGYALLGALLALVVLSLLAAAGLLLTSVEVDVAGSHREAAEALLRAEAGLGRAFAETLGAPPSSRLLPVPGGTAEVAAELLVRFEDGRPLYRLRSRSRSPGGELREVERLAVALPPLGPVPAALTAPHGVSGGGAEARVSGLDRAPTGGCERAPRDAAGVSVLPGGAAEMTAGRVEGTPPVRETTYPTEPAMEEGAAVVDRLLALAAAAGPVVAVAAGARIGSAASGSGVLVSPGALVMEDGFRWEGVVVAGGALSLRGAPVVHGAVLAGVGTGSDSLSGAAGVDLGGGAVEIAYDRCRVEAALLAAARLVPVRGTSREAF